MTAHLIKRVAVLGTGLIGGSFALALRKYTSGIHISGWDDAKVVSDAHARGAIQAPFYGELGPALESADLIYIALPIGAMLDMLPEIARLAPAHAFITDACSTKLRITQAAADLFPGDGGPMFLGGHPMAGRELAGIASATPDLFRDAPYALIDEVPPKEDGSSAGHSVNKEDARVQAFVKILQKLGARPIWLGAQRHDYAVGLASHLPQLAAVALASFLYDRLDENGLPITLAGPGLRDSLRLAGSPYHTWRDIVLTKRDVLSAALDLFARRIEDLRERLGSRELEADFDSANELYKLLRGL